MGPSLYSLVGAKIVVPLMHDPVIFVTIVGHKSGDTNIELFNRCSKFSIFHELNISCYHDYLI